MFRKSKKWIIIVAVLILLILVGVGIKRFLPARPLTTEQKLKDFNYLYDVLIEHQPMLEEYKEVIGFDFEGNKEYYEELIRNTKDDYEFFVIMDMIMEDFPGAHTGLNIESFDEIEKSGHTYSKEVKKAFGGRDRSEYWQKYYMNYVPEDTGKSIFLYYDGIYISNLCASDKQEEQTVILLSIDGEHIDEYIRHKEVNGRLAYDEYNDKVYRCELELNLRYGQLVKATFQNGSGEIFEREIYIRNKDCAFEGERIEFIDIPGEDKPVIPEVDIAGIQYIKKEPGFNVVLDKERNLSYVCIFSLDDDDIDWEQVADGMQKACEKDNIILDLRINTGGEGQGGTAFYDIMPNSKLTFMVQDSQCFNLDGTDNSIYGTSPDYYIPYTFESIAKCDQLIKEKVSVYDYENRLKWDNVLLETIKIIENKEE